ncbi:sulfite oxidase-like oxidoreductase [Streptomyces sp. WAC 01420]|nr:sulfite oxidase-like oxidoreductase [Streptomyces sp. WAC 01438]RSM96349.1 sulfite oxidase-like oxidoreductase [Streptomyces sp. WAC 01420]
MSRLPINELSDGLIALRESGHESALRQVLKFVAQRTGGEVFEAVLALRARHSPQDAERLIWDFTQRRNISGHIDYSIISAPDQRTRSSWGAKHFGPVPRFKPERWEFRIFGATAMHDITSFSLDQFQNLPKSQVSADLHCVSKWTWPGNVWSGVKASTLLDLVPPATDVTHIMVWAEYGYSANLRLSDVLYGDAIFATHNHGERLSLPHGFPLRLVVPHLYGYKGPKWVRGIEYMTSDRRGFWEERGYHNIGEVQYEQRYSYDEGPDQGPPL